MPSLQDDLCRAMLNKNRTEEENWKRVVLVRLRRRGAVDKNATFDPCVTA